MITADEAISIISTHAYSPEVETLPLADCLGRILQEDIYADRDFPPFDRVTMDGIAISFEDWEKGQRLFRRETEQFAGSQKVERSVSKSCIETATGAICPGNCDVVIPYEWLDEDGDCFRVSAPKEVKKWMNIHKQGLDRSEGSLLIPAGQRIAMPEMTVLASVGKDHVRVNTIPKLAVISTGDELVPVEKTPLPHQIRRSNDVTVKSIFDGSGFQIDRFHLNDDELSISAWLDSAFETYDALIFSGGVSMGKRDLLPSLLAKAGITQHFHKVTQRPGKPLWFGTGRGTAVFGLPGNPVSTAVNAARFVRDAYFTHFYSNFDRVVELSEPIVFKPQLTFYCPFKLGFEGVKTTATPAITKGSGDFASLLGSDGFVVLSSDNDTFPKGSQQVFVPWKRN